MTIDPYGHLPTRQALFVSRIARDLAIAERVAAQATHIKDYQRWTTVVIDLKNDIAKAIKEGWRP